MSIHPPALQVPSRGTVRPDRRPAAPLSFGGTFVLLLVVSLWRAPVPAVNEPHYLAKAKFWWNPAWCAGDFFLESSNPHVVFYAAIGWLTRWLTLEQTAYVGRIAALLLLSAGWQKLARRLFRSPWGGPAAAAVFLGLAAWGNFAGEWLVGGVEGKVFAYACWLWGCASWWEGRSLAAAVWAGAAVAFHPVVGLWSLLAALFAVVVGRVTCRHGTTDPATASPLLIRAATDPAETAGSPAGDWRRLTLAAVVLALASLPGLWPAMQLVVGVDPELARQADRITLTQRLGHHLDPLLFPAAAYRQYAVLLLGWMGLSWLAPRQSFISTLQRFVVGALLIAGVGLVVGWLPAATGLDPLHSLRLMVLKFYPFRLADLALPLAVAVLTVHFVESSLWQAASRDWPATAGRIGLTLVGLVAALLLPAPDANASGMSPADRRDWIAVCRWLRERTPPGALIATANESWAVKWFAERPEYVSFKDCPQEARGIVEWWRRRQVLVAWSRAARQDGRLTPEELQVLHDRTRIDYLIVNARRYGGFVVGPVFRQGPFEVYRIPP
jgi:hypothetical protein